MKDINYYNDYGFSEDNVTVVHSDVRGIDDKVIGSVYTLQEEERNWKEEIKQHIINEHEDTREIVNNHTTEEVDAAEEKIMNKLETMYTKLNNISSNIISIKNSQDTQTSLLNNIWGKVR
jgi:hypothetical protein